MKHILVSALLSVTFLTGCTTIISEQARKSVNSDAPFKAIKAAPEKFIGKNVLLGGRIANIVNSNEGAQIEIVQFDLNSRDYPEDRFVSYGRFLATDSNFYDPMIFKIGMLITLAGEIKGKKVLRLDGMDYSYPIIGIREWHLWPNSGPDNTGSYPLNAPQYNPYNYGLGTEPFFQRPFSPGGGPR